MLGTVINNGGNGSPVTIVTVVYNGAKHLEETIQSVISLQCVAPEYIIIDGGSNDGTIDIIRKYENRINFWTSEKDNGIYDAMNKGWERAGANSHVLFLGAGDRILSLPADMNRYRFNDVVYGRVMLGGNKYFFPRAGTELKVRNTLHHQALLINKSFHPEKPFDTRFKLFADFDFNQRLLKMGANFVYADSLEGFAMPAGVSSRFDISESLRIVKKNFGTGWSMAALLYFIARRVFVRTRDFITKLLLASPCP